MYDIVVVGGGLVGNSALLALAHLNEGLKKPLKIALVDAGDSPSEEEASVQEDERSIALSYSSWQFFNALGFWETLAPYALPLKEVHISQAGCFGKTTLSADEQGVGALGYVIPARKLYAKLKQPLLQFDYFYKATCKALEHKQDATLLVLNDGRRIQTQLVIASDGAHSSLRQMAGIKTKEKVYSKKALVTNVTVQDFKPIGFERFMGGAILAMVPSRHDRFGVIWKTQSAVCDHLITLPETQFLDNLQEAFGFRLGKFSRLGPRQCFPLTFVRALPDTQPGLVLLGDAAHALPPVGAQGFNLSVRDIAALVETIQTNLAQGLDLNGKDFFKSYSQWRAKDQKRIMTLADMGLSELLGDFPRSIKGLAWLGLDVCHHFKDRFTKRMMGSAGLLPKLSMGVGLYD